MDGSKIETTKGLCVVALTKYLMNKYNWTQDRAYAGLLKMELSSI